MGKQVIPSYLAYSVLWALWILLILENPYKSKLILENLEANLEILSILLLFFKASLSQRPTEQNQTEKRKKLCSLSFLNIYWCAQVLKNVWPMHIERLKVFSVLCTFRIIIVIAWKMWQNKTLKAASSGFYLNLFWENGRWKESLFAVCYQNVE